MIDREQIENWPCVLEKELTKGQAARLADLRETGFIEWSLWPYTARNLPLRALVAKGFAKEGWGPRDSMLKTQGILLDE